MSILIVALIAASGLHIDVSSRPAASTWKRTQCGGYVTAVDLSIRCHCL